VAAAEYTAPIIIALSCIPMTGTGISRDINFGGGGGGKPLAIYDWCLLKVVPILNDIGAGLASPTTI